MKKYQQDNVKDVGGFVAESLRGRRRKENVLSVHGYFRYGLRR